MKAVALGPFLIIGVIFVLILLKTFGIGLVGGGYRPRPRHWIMRMICGVIGLGLLAGMGWCTIRNAREGFSLNEAGRSLTIQVPANPAPILPASFVDYKQGRALIHFVFVDDTIEPAVPVYAKAFAVNWPGEKDKQFADEFTAGTLKIKYSFSVDVMQPQPSPSALLTMGEVYLQWKRNGIMGTQLSNLHSAFCSGGYLTNLSYGVMDKSPFSLIRFPPQRLQALVFVNPLANNDPLKSVTLDAFAGLYKDKMAKVIQHRSYQVYFSPYIPVTLAGYLGASTVVLLLATSLLTQLFVRRHLAFAAMMVIVLLYVAALDRWVLNRNISILETPKAPAASRLFACRQMQQTFFYRHAAVKHLSAILEDNTTPPQLQDMARVIKFRVEEGSLP